MSPTIWKAVESSLIDDEMEWELYHAADAEEAAQKFAAVYFEANFSAPGEVLEVSVMGAGEWRRFRVTAVLDYDAREVES